MDKEFKVIKIDLEHNNEYGVTRLVINGGINQNIYRGHNFVVYSLGDEIFDPITKESLGRLEVFKGNGKVIYTQDSMSIIESSNIKRQRKRVYSFDKNFLGNCINHRIIDEWYEYIIPFDKPKIGDIARLVQ